MKVLFIRLSSIGDIVLTTPAVRCLKQQMPQVELHYLVKPEFAAIFDANPYIDRLWTLAPRLSDTLQQLRAEQYDYIIDLHGNWRSLRIKMALWRVHSRTFDKLTFRKWLLTTWGINRLPDVHIVARYMATLAHWHIADDGKGLDYFIPSAYEVQMPQLFPQVGTQTYGAVVVGAAHATKQIPDAQLIELCRQIAQPVVLLGGKADAERGIRIAEQAGSHVTNACGMLHLHQSASVLSQADWVLTPDTGMMHIAAALGKRILSVWGNTVPQLGMYPYRPHAQSRQFEVAGLACRPCSKLGYAKCPQGHFRCMTDQNMAQIAANAQQIE